MRAAALVVIALLSACRPAPPPWVTAFDPLAALPLAEAHAERSRLQPPPRNPAARAAGWLPAAATGPRWSRGRAVEVAAFLVAPRPLALVVRVAAGEGPGRGEDGAAAPSGSEAVRLAVLVNGAPAGELVVGAAVGEHRLPLPAELLRAGENRLRFEPRPGPEASGRPPRLAFHDLRLAPVTDAGAPRRRGDTLELPLGSAVDWYLAVPGRAVLELPAVSGPEGARLLVSAQGAGGEPQELARVEPGGHRRWLELPEGQEGVVRLGFAALPGGGEEAAAGPLRVERPRVLAREPQIPAATPAAPPAATPAVERAAGATAGAGGRPPILLYVVDALRADRLGVYGCPRPLTPNLDRFAAEATVFGPAIAQAPWTRPAVATLFTGLSPLRHGVTRLQHRLPAAATTLAERLHQGGYRTAAVSTNAHITRATGLIQGFEHFDFLPRQASAGEAHGSALAWLDAGGAAGAPFFLYLHVLEPHAPYTPPADLRKRFAPGVPAEAGTRPWLERLYRSRGAERRALAAMLPALYDAEVAAADRAFGELRAELERRGLWDELLVVVVGDHGEGLGERGAVGHAQDLYQEALAVPLLVKRPGQRRGERVDGPVQQSDVAPTLLAAAGLPAGDMEGVDLLGGPAAVRPLLSHLDYRGREGLAVLWGRWKWIEPLSRRFAAAPELYDLAADPGETRNLAADAPVVAGWLRTLARAERLAASARSEDAELDDATREALEALGYL